MTDESTTEKRDELLPDGIHLGLSLEAYLADPALGSSDLKNLLISPLKYWVNSHLNPNRTPSKSTPAKQLGTLIHEVVLENTDKIFVAKPEGMSFATKEGKAWRQTRLDDGAEIITADENRTLASIIEACRRSGVTEMINGSIPEVTYIWTHESGHRCKIRLDALKGDMAFDLKTFANQMDKDLGTCIAYATGNLRYHISAVWYRTGIDHMRAAIDGGKVNIQFHADSANKIEEFEEILSEIKDGAESHFAHWYIYLEKDGVPNVIPRQFVRNSRDGQPDNEYWKSAQRGVDYATCIFAEHMAEFEPGEMWVRPTHWKSFTDEELGAARSIFDWES